MIVKLLKRETVVEGTLALYFHKPPGFVFKAGQYLELTLMNPPETDAEGDGRAFSIASAPSVLNSAGVNADDIRPEEFAGY